MDREKVIKGYMICVKHGLLNGEDCHGHHQWKDNHYEIEKVNDYSKECPYNGCETGCVKTLTKDALALLKEQEHKDKMFHALEDDWKRLKELLKEQEAEIAFLKAMQLQTVHNMSNEDIGNAVRNVLRL